MLYGNAKEIEAVYANGKKIDRVYANGKLVWESTIYVSKPTLSGTYTFNGGAQSVTINGFDETSMAQSGTVTATDAGTYHVYIELKKGYAWADETTAQLDLTWSIAKKTVAVPTLSTTSFSWVEGTSHTVSVSGFDATYISQSGDLSQTDSSSNIGTNHTVTWSLKNTTSCTWTDGSNSSKTATWSAKWVNGTSHYAKDLYNSGWHNGSLAKIFEDSEKLIVTFNSDHILYTRKDGNNYIAQRIKDTSGAIQSGKTFHVAFNAYGITGTGTSPSTKGNLGIGYFYYSSSSEITGSIGATGTGSKELSYKYSSSDSKYSYGIGIGANTEAKITRVWVD